MHQNKGVRRRAGLLVAAAVAATTPVALAQSFTVTSNASTGAGSLTEAIQAANAWNGSSAFTINFSSGVNVSLSAELPIFNNSRGVIVNGNGATINGNNTYRGFFLGVGAGEAAVSPGLTATTSTAWRISNLTIQNAVAQGGRGGGGGGGGAGMGGAIFVNAGQLTMENVNLSNNTARGGNAPIATGGNAFGGGGGMGGDARMGGGGFGRFVEGPVDNGSYFAISSGHAGNFTGGAAGGAALNNATGLSQPGPQPGGSNGGGGGNNQPPFYAFGGGGGVGGEATISGSDGPTVTGNGGFGGGGGSSGAGGGHGGYGGGGGGGLAGNFGGNGGFGGGAGASFNPGAAGFGGGSGRGGATTSQGGGGAGLGGAVFVRQGASIEIINGGISGGTAVGGNGFTNGQGIGSGLFLAGSATFNISGSTTINDSIGGGSDSLITGGLTKTGNGTLVLNGDNSYVGGTTVNGGVLRIGNANALGSDLSNNPLQITNAQFINAAPIEWSRPVSIVNVGVIQTQAFASLSNVTLGGTLTKLGGDILQLNATGNQLIGVGAGELRAAATGGLGGGTVSLFDETTLSGAAGNISVSNPVELRGNRNVFINAPFAASTFAVNGPISGDASVTIANDLTGVVALGGNNSYTGGTYVTGGTLSVGSNANLGASYGMLTLDGGTLRVTGTTFASTSRFVWLGLNGGGIDVVDPAHTFTISQNLEGGSSDFPNSGLTKRGAGTLQLTGANSYGGGTIVNGGTLAMGRNATATGSPVLSPDSGPITVNAGATLRFDTNDNFGGHNTTSGPDVIVNSGTVTNSGGYINALQNLTLNGSTLSAVGAAGSYGSFSVRNTLTSTGNSTISMTGGGALALSHAGTTTFEVPNGTLTVSAPIIDNVSPNAGRLRKTGFGALVLTGNNTFSGGVSLERGELAINADAALGVAGVPINISGGILRTDASMTIARPVALPSTNLNGVGIINTNGHDVTLNGAITGGVSSLILKQGPGTLTLTNTGNSQGTTRIDDGVVVVGDDRHLGLDGGGGVSMTGGTLRAAASFTTAKQLSLAGPNQDQTIDTNGHTVVWNGWLLGVGRLVQAGGGTLVLTGDNRIFSGSITASDFGAIAINNDRNLGETGNVVHLNNGALRTDAAMTLDRSLQIQSGKVGFFNTNGNDVTFTGVVSGNGGFIKQGAGTLTLTNIDNSQSNNRIDAGVLAISDDRHLGTSGGTLFTTGGTLRTDASISTNRSISLQGGAGSTTTIDTAGNTLAWNGVISGAGNLIKSGDGTLTMSRPNTFAGDVIVQGGTLALANNALSSGAPTLLSPALTVNAGSTLRFDTNDNFGGHNTATGPNIVINGGIVTNSGGFINALQNVTLNDGTMNATAEFGQFGAFSVRDTITSTGSSTIDLGASRLTIGQDGDTTFNVSSGTLSVASTIADNVDRPGTLNKTGVGTLILSGNNTFSGGVSTSDFGTLAITSDAALGASTNAIRFDNGLLRTDASMTINRDVNIDTGRVAFFNTNGNNVTLVGKVDGQGGFIKQGNGTLTLGNISNSQSNNRIDAGVVAISDDRQLGLPGGALFLYGGTLRVDDSITVDRPFIAQASSTIDFSNHDITLAGSLDVPTDATLTLDGDAHGGVVITANATGAGTTVLRATPAGFGVPNVPTRFIIGDGGTNGSLPTGPIRFESVENGFGSGQARLVFDRSDAYTVPSDITGDVLEGIIIRGGGTLVYTGNNNSPLDRTDVVGNSSLVVDGPWGGRVFVGSTDTLTNIRGAGTLGGTGTITEGVTVGSTVAGTIRGDWGTGTGTLTINETLSISGGVERGTIAVQLLTDADGNLLDQSNLSVGDLVLGTTFGPLSVQLLNDAALTLGQTYTIELLEARSGGFGRNGAFNVTSYPASDFNLLSSSGLEFDDLTPTIDNNRLLLTFTVVPEPASLSLLVGGAGLMVRRRRSC